MACPLLRPSRLLLGLLVLLGLSGCRPAAPQTGDFQDAGLVVPSMQTVFIVVMENHDWSSIQGNASAPYLNQTLLPMGAHAENDFNPPGVHPSLPNYLWMVSGQDFGIRNDGNPSQNSQATTENLGHLMNAAQVSWKSYQEDIPGDACPLTAVNRYAPKHNPFVYFDELTDGVSATSATCIAHVRPLSELETDLSAGTVPRFVFITPNLCNDMHDCSIQSGDDWLALWVPKILASSAYQQSGALFITWDEAATGDGPIGLIVLSPLGKSGGYSNDYRYTHGSLLRTVEEGLGLSPLLGDAAQQTNLGDLFLPK